MRTMQEWKRIREVGVRAAGWNREFNRNYEIRQCSGQSNLVVFYLAEILSFLDSIINQLSTASFFSLT
jgi:hypothetical protein